jgi:hypothetical protein
MHQFHISKTTQSTIINKKKKIQKKLSIKKGFNPNAKKKKKSVTFPSWYALVLAI